MHDTKIYNQSSVSSRKKNQQYLIHDFADPTLCEKLHVQSHSNEPAQRERTRGRMKKQLLQISYVTTTVLSTTFTYSVDRLHFLIQTFPKERITFAVNITEHRPGIEESQPVFHNRNRFIPFLQDYMLLSI